MMNFGCVYLIHAQSIPNHQIFYNNPSILGNIVTIHNSRIHYDNKDHLMAVMVADL